MKDLDLAITAAMKEFMVSYDVDSDTVTALTNILKKHLPNRARAGITPKVVVTARRKTAYNIFIREQFGAARARAAETNTPNNSQELMTLFSKSWQNLTAEQKAPYEEMAAAESAGVVKSTHAPANKRGMSGYNLFYRERKDELSVEAKALEVKLMAHVGAAWKALSKEEKESWTARAKAESGAAAPAQQDAAAPAVSVQA